MDKNKLTLSVAGKEISFETGKIARQANGAVMVTSGETMLLSTACCKKDAAEDIDFFPLRIDYQEKFSSAGKTLGGFLKREGKPSEKETLTARLIDRPIRPLFPNGYFNEVQILNTVFSYDSNCPPDPLAICGSSAALLISDIPFNKPLAAVRVGMINDEFVINPSSAEQKESILDLVIAGTQDGILMIEGYCDFLTEEQVLDAINEGHEQIKHICQALSDWQNIVGKEKVEPVLRLPSEDLLQEVETLAKARLEEALKTTGKLEQQQAMDAVSADVFAHFADKEDSPYSSLQVKAAYKKISAQVMRTKILKEQVRPDGRGLQDIRPISIESALLPRSHGSALFTRGETQSIAICTLGGESMGQRYETLDGEGIHKFYLQYSFPPFSVGEVGRSGPPGRREIGHGKLAERALVPIMPGETFPYTIRLESVITESNGSSSMASVCGGCLAMMDAGVPVKRPVSGIAMGLILEKDNFCVLSDIMGMEDFLGDMDFKITGDQKGITAFQMDIKVEGITLEIMETALLQAKEGRIHILHKMVEAVPQTKDNLSPHAPRIEMLQIKPSKIATVIGPGGKMIRSIMEESGAELDINDDGKIHIVCQSQKGAEIAKKLIHDLTAEVEKGKIYKGPVTSIQSFGAFVRLPGGKDGLCHISEICHERVQNVSDHIKEGDELEVKVLDINERGQIKLSRKALLEKPSRSFAKN